MPEALRTKCAASLKNLPAIVEKVLAAAANCNISKDQAGQLELAFEEAMVNVCSYAYPEGEGGAVEVVAGNNPEGFFVQIIDDGAPFNPLTSPPPNLDVDIADRKIGGLGIHLIRNLMNNVKYRRENNQNILELILTPDKT